MKKHLVFIINPKSGTDRIKAMQSAIDARLDGDQFSYEIQTTQRAKHGTELAQKAAEQGVYAVIAIGGDGSVNDVAAGLLGTKTVLGIIPKGSGNGMARTMKLPLKIEDAIDVLNLGRTVKMDVGFVNDKLFISNAGVGFDALVSKKFSRSERRGLGVYSWLVTKYLWLYKEWEYRITIDGKELKERAFLVNVANGQQFGYNFKIAPKASYTDGEFDVIIIRKFPKMLGGALTVRALMGTILRSPYVRFIKAKEIIITHPDLKLMQTDGDAHACNNRLHFRIVPAALEVIVP